VARELYSSINKQYQVLVPMQQTTLISKAFKSDFFRNNRVRENNMPANQPHALGNTIIS
jgi:hypothetical protein